jgi:MFS family permease
MSIDVATPSPAPAPATTPALTPALTAIFAIACGVIVANLYYAQALIGDIAPALGLSESRAGAIVTLTQLGYGAGLFLIVSLADLVENRRLILLLTAGTCAGLIGIASSSGAAAFLAFSFVTGFCAVGAQIIVPLAAHLAPEATRGRTVGNIMGGLIAGIMLARPVANALAAVAGWRAIFIVAAVLTGALALVLARIVPERRPTKGPGYRALLGSSLTLLVRNPAIRRRTAYQAAMFAAFNMFWTAVPLVLARQFDLGQGGIALFALASVGRPRACARRHAGGAGAGHRRVRAGRLGGRGTGVDPAGGCRGAARCRDADQPGTGAACHLWHRSGGARTDQRHLHDDGLPGRSGGIDVGVGQLLSRRLDGDRDPGRRHRGGGAAAVPDGAARPILMRAALSCPNRRHVLAEDSA